MFREIGHERIDKGVAGWGSALVAAYDGIDEPVAEILASKVQGHQFASFDLTQGRLQRHIDDCIAAHGMADQEMQLVRHQDRVRPRRDLAEMPG